MLNGPLNDNLNRILPKYKTSGIVLPNSHFSAFQPGTFFGTDWVEFNVP